jgi:hypothetical protein
VGRNTGHYTGVSWGRNATVGNNSANVTNPVRVRTPTPAQKYVMCFFSTSRMVGSIPVEKLMPLLVTITAHMRSIGFRSKKSSANYAHVLAAEDEDLFSNTVQEFFKENQINPSELYPEFYSKDRHTIAVSYVWSKTSLSSISGRFFSSLLLDFIQLCTKV